jgi:hypothetical protein
VLSAGSGQPAGSLLTIASQPVIKTALAVRMR